jgi:EAL and modified HD-GYP domain-containing signal transduction protein
VLTNSFHAIGMDVLTRGKPAFVNFTRNLLVREVASIFPSNMVKIEVLESVEPDETVIKACHRLKRAGYDLVLDDFIFEEKFRPLAEIADIIKVDFLNTKGAERWRIMDKIGTRNKKYLAEKVETHEDFDEAVIYGYEYFQGYFFGKPTIISGTDIPVHKQNNLQLIHAINNPETDFDVFEKLIKRDVSISYKLMDYINSAYFGFPHKIRSIKHALALLGLDEIRKWLSVVALANIGQEKSEALITTSLIRANFCEFLAQKIGYNYSEMFLTGLFSMIDAFLDRPMADIMSKLPLSDEIKRTLLGEDTPQRPVFELVLAYEKADWDKYQHYVEQINLDDEEVPQGYYQAVEKTGWTVVPY